eukprot:s3268_g2.t1
MPCIASTSEGGLCRGNHWGGPPPCPRGYRARRLPRRGKGDFLASKGSGADPPRNPCSRPEVSRLVGLTAMLEFSGLLRSALVICIAAVLFGLSAAQTDVVTPWVDVCTSEDFSAEDREELCPATFVVSTLAYNPLYPGSLANITIILQPSRDLPSSIQRTQYIDFNLVGFEAVGTQNTANALIRDLEITAGNTVPLGVDPLFGYNTQQNPLFTTPALYNLNTRLLRLTVRTGQSLLAGTDTEVTICCMRLPTSSPQDFSGYTISGPTSLDTLTSINEEPILNSPEIDPGLQWDFLRVAFAPPVSSSLTIIHLTIRPANPLTDRARIILSMPLVQRENNVSGEVNFNTANSLDGADWMFFESRALWDAMEGKLTFFLREGRVLDRQVTLSTEPDEFRLPIELEADSPTLEVSARSFDNIDEVVRETPVTQSSAVPHVRNFTFTRLMYSNNMRNQMSSVMFHFSTNRPLFAGSVVYLRLSGFTSQRVQVPLKGTTKANFRDESAVFNIPENEIELHVVRTLYSDEYVVQVELTELILPPALYANDTSLLVWNSDPGAPRQPVDDSPMVGMGDKTFRRSQLAFDPAEPRLAANVSFTLEPTIVFYQGDSIVIHMYGFACTLTSIPLLGADAFRIENQAASWTQEDSMLVFTVAENEIISNAMPFRVSIGRDSVFRLPDKLSENDGILRIEGKGALIDLEPIKKIPKVGTDKFVIESIVEFEPEDSSINAFTRISFSLVLNTDVLPNSTMYIKLGGLVRDPGRTNLIGVQGAARSGTVKISGANGPLFRNEEGYWDQDQVLLTVQMVSTVQIFAGERVRFFIERDQDFKLPYSAYQSDPSFRLAVPEAGIPERPFQFSTRVSQEGKLFIVSEIYYGSRGAVAYPNTVVEFNFWFRPNVNLPAGTTVRLKLPGFTCPFTDVPIGTQEVPVSNAYDLSDFIRTGIWDQMAETFDLVVPIGQQIYRQQPTVLRIMESSGFRLPATPLLPNDPSLTIQAIGNVVIFEEPIKTSPRVVDRSFMVSEFIYAPPQQDSIFQLKMILQPTVNITEDNDIIIFLHLQRRVIAEPREVPNQRIIDRLCAVKGFVLAMLRPGGPRSRWTRWLRILAVCGMTFQMRGFVLGALSPRAARSVRLQAAGDSDKNFNKQKFLRRPEFDPLSLQDFRREALLQYSNTNQSEPLRILIFLFLTICGLFSPTFFPSNAGPPFFVAAATVTLTSGFLFLRERGKRTAQLVRLEREYSIGDLSVELSDPVSGRSYFEALAENKSSSGDCLWVGLNFRGRVFGSDFGCPIWDEVLAAMPPIKRLSSLEERYAMADATGALEAQEEFYRALCEGDVQAMAAIFAPGLQWPGFRNSLAKVNIHIMGEDRFRIDNSMGYWNETTARLRLSVPLREVIPAFTMMDLRIEESQGFLLPAALNANDTSLTIQSVNNIQEEPIKTSPMVGNGPFAGHMFCMYQYEVGTRSPSPICATALDCNPPLTDPCNPQELLRCGCDARVDEVFPMSILGFNLQQEDSVHFLPNQQRCSFDLIGPRILNPFSEPLSQVVSEGQDQITYEGMTSIQTGLYRVCAIHVGRLYDVGMVVVRPSCAVPLVLVDGACVEHCPRTKIPIAGKCMRDTLAFHARDTQDYMLPIRMTDPYESSGTAIASRSSDDAEQRYFIYRYVYEMGKILNADPTRITVASLSNGSVVVNTVFKVVGTWNDIKSTDERSPWGLISLLKALQADTSSQLYQSPFFKFIDRSAMPEPLPVRLCDDGVFRVFCPYTGGIMSTGEALGILFLGIAIVPLALGCLCCGLWHIDVDKGSVVDVDDIVEKLQEDPSQVDPKLQIEYAESWLQGRFMGEEWQKQRRVIASIAY